eukprot:1077588-Ditylum_brightwellii.AAC.1
MVAHDPQTNTAKFYATSGAYNYCAFAAMMAEVYGSEEEEFLAFPTITEETVSEVSEGASTEQTTAGIHPNVGEDKENLHDFVNATLPKMQIAREDGNLIAISNRAELLC